MRVVKCYRGFVITFLGVSGVRGVFRVCSFLFVFSFGSIRKFRGYGVFTAVREREGRGVFWERLAR